MQMNCKIRQKYMQKCKTNVNIPHHISQKVFTAKAFDKKLLNKITVTENVTE